VLVSSAADRDDAARRLRAAGFSVELVDRIGAGDAVRREAMLLLDLADAADTDETWRMVAEEGQRAGAPPVLVLTAAERRADIARALDAGARDAIGRPLDTLEFVARTRAALRHNQPPATGAARYRDALLTADFASFKATFAGHTATLSTTEARLLAMFVTHPGQLLTQEQILDHVWGSASAVSSDQVKLYVSYLRRKLGMPPRGGPIHSVRGRGYRFDPAAE
jgi:DNA-binding response OmpR family regulator